MSGRQAPSGRPVGHMEPAAIQRRETRGVKVGFVDTEPAGENWREAAACTDPRVDPEVWFASGSGPAEVADTAAAKQVCRLLCPVRWTCAKYAFDSDLRDGVFGGFDVEERRLMQRRLRDRRARADAE